jgi:hypothetical protein
MSIPGMEKMKVFMALLCFMFVLAAAPSASSAADQRAMSKQPASSDSEIMSHALMTGHIGEALHAVRDNKDLKGAATHTQMAIKAGETVQVAFGKSKVDPEEVTRFNEGIQSLREALQMAQSGDSAGFEKATQTAMEKVTTQCPPHGPGCVTVGCGCGAQLNQTCDPMRPAKKCTAVGCNCYCL